MNSIKEIRTDISEVLIIYIDENRYILPSLTLKRILDEANNSADLESNGENIGHIPE